MICVPATSGSLPVVLSRVSRASHCRRAPDTQDGVNLVLDVREDSPITISLQPLVNEGPQNHLEAHGPFELGGGRSREHPSPIQKLSRNHQENPCLVLEHRHLPVPPNRITFPVIVRRVREALPSLVR